MERRLGIPWLGLSRGSYRELRAVSAPGARDTQYPAAYAGNVPLLSCRSVKVLVSGDESEYVTLPVCTAQFVMG